ncbi:MAG: hypothetical protein HY318_12880 [Armatimonadetes bacterium]|nr:hypothetical protein [Armatimonadota bacterium]
MSEQVVDTEKTQQHRAEAFHPSDEAWHAIASFELPKIAMRSMEHGSHPGRFLNDFRKQFSGSPVVYSTILGYGPPGRIFAELLSLFIFERLIFGSYYANVEKPFIHFPGKPEDEPKDFLPGAVQLEKLLPCIEFLAQEISRFFRHINHSYEQASVWFDGLGEIERRVQTLVQQSPLFEIPTKVFDDTALIKYQPEDVILEFRQLERFTKILLYAVREESLPESDKTQLLAQVLSVLTAYHRALDKQWGDILYQNRTTGVRQDMRPRAAEYVYSCVTLVHSEISALLSGDPPPAIPENPEEPAVGQTMDIDLFREMVMYSVDAEAFIASKLLAHEIAEDRVQFAQGITLKSELNLTEIVRSLSDQIKPEGEERIDIIVPQNVDLFLAGNERRVRGLFTNLVTNSFQFGKHIRIRLEYDPVRERATVRLSDNGRGVHPDLLTWDQESRRVTIFKLGQTRRRADLGAQAGGTGVGTTESFWDAEMHGGNLALEETVRAPNPAQGTTFMAELPAEARALWRRFSLHDFVREIRGDYTEEVIEAAERSLGSLKGRARRLLEERGLILRETGDLLNRDHLEYIDAVVVTRSLFAHAASMVTTILAHYLLPMELDRIDPRIFAFPSAAARRSVVLLRLMARVGNMETRRRERLLKAIEASERSVDQASANLIPLTPMLRSSLDRDLSGREHLALSHAIEEQKRTYLATEGLDHIYREVQRLSNRVRGVFVRRPTGVRLQRLLERKAVALVEAIQVLLREESGGGPVDGKQAQLEREHLLDFVRRALVQPVGERMGDFPVDWRSLIVYLAEHGVLARVLERLPQNEIRQWLEEMDHTLPLAAAFLDPQLYEDDYERAIDDPATPVHTRLMLKSDLPQVAMLTDAERVREVHQFLTGRGVQPKPRGLDYIRPVLKRIIEITRAEVQEGTDSLLDKVLTTEPTTQPRRWEEWLTYLVKLQPAAALSQISLMNDEDLRRLRAVVETALVVGPLLIESGLFDNILENYGWWQESTQLPPDRFDNLIAQVTQMHAQTTQALMEDILLSALKAATLWGSRGAADPELAQPSVNSEALLSSLRSAGAAAWSEHLPAPIREALQESTETLS